MLRAAVSERNIHITYGHWKKESTGLHRTTFRAEFQAFVNASAINSSKLDDD
ncbi:hypothetical protein DPMN_000793 [Dreissena polymorpha]|uniref:Uncharacterized protein n=1 Tax=Dreissena polymorpha TaxID=45954 RepID=A0A9D4MIU8_DREPO|nr:hypothetical protein DPMN_000793 [Dreissena polymorpha]